MKNLIWLIYTVKFLKFGTYVKMYLINIFISWVLFKTILDFNNFTWTDLQNIYALVQESILSWLSTNN